MKLDKKLQKMPEKSHRRMEKIGIILGGTLLAACGFSYVILESFGQ